MVIVFGVAPEEWPPAPEMTQQLAQKLNLPSDELKAAFDTVFEPTLEERKKVLVTIQRMADILAHIGNERLSLLERLASIARLSAV
jgi:hypothetical protein